jgi:hypothetical protein
MTTGHTFHEFGDLIDDLESTGITIIDITPHEKTLLTEESLSLTVSVGVPVFNKIDTNDVEITPQDADALTDGTVTLDFSVQVPLSHDSEERAPENRPEHESDHTEGNTQPEDTEPEDAGKIQSTESKPYQDPDRLREVYDEYDTFPAMTDALDVDVTAQTVRSNMIQQGIHEPKTNGTDTDAGESDTEDDAQQSEREVEDSFENEEEVVLSDGMGLPAGMTLDEFKTAVHTSRSFLDVQRELGGDRDYTYRILKELNLIDLVHGRLSKKAEREPSLKEIESRIQQSTTQ